jgi:hypothetical protein
MTLDEIDKLLADWQSKLTLASNNLLELDGLTTYKRLSGDGGLSAAQLTGVTQTRVQPAIDSMGELWKSLQALNDLVNRAVETRKAIPRYWVSDNSLRAIEQMLTGPSIKLSAANTPLAQRGLLSGAEQSQIMTPEHLLNIMTQTFDATKRVVLDVDAAWTRLEPALAACDSEAKTLESIAQLLGQGTLPELTAVQERIRVATQLIQSDPLGVNTDLSREIRPLLSRVRDRLTELKAQREQVQGDLTRARSLLETLRGQRQQCIAALAECRAKIENPPGLREPLSETAVQDLAQWLTTLENTLQQGRWQSASVGVKRWQQTAETYLTAERVSFVANHSPIEACAEMRGRLSSLRAKAQAYGARGQTLDPALVALAGQAEQLLQRTPTPLAQAAAAVADYETRLARALARIP